LADITLLNMNMLYVRYTDSVEKELHVPLGTLYLTRALEDAGYSVDFRDYQLNDYDDPFAPEAVCDYLADASSLIGVSVMANLLPFALRALEQVKQRFPDRTIVLGGVGAKSVERKILERFPWIDAVAYGEGEGMIVALCEAHRRGVDFASVPNLFWRAKDGRVVENDPAPRIEDLDTIPFPAWDRIDLKRYDGYGVMASRGCPYPCTFCSVAPIWGHAACRRSDANIIAEMRELQRRAGVDLFLFQDEFFVTSPAQVERFCGALASEKLHVDWKAFGRVNLSEPSMMRKMADSGCLELRFGIESGSEAVLEKTKKGFRSSQAVDVVSEAVGIFDRVDAFYVWGFPFETMDDFNQSLFQMVSFRMMGARILPSLLSFLPQTEIFAEYGDEGRALTFCRELFPEYMLTGHEICTSAHVEVGEQHREIFDFIEAHPDLFPGFFHYDLEGNVLPKLRALQELGFYPVDDEELEGADSCGGHSPRVGQATTAKAQLTVA
jgi:anaerobic magnesium-protoporphyrin IX monomethyl ester cyclase